MLSLDTIDALQLPASRTNSLSLDEFELPEIKSPVLSHTYTPQKATAKFFQVDFNCGCCKCRCDCHLNGNNDRSMADSCTQTLSTGDVVITKVFFHDSQLG